MSQTNSLNIILSEDMVRFVRTTGFERRARIYFKLAGEPRQHDRHLLRWPTV